MPPVGGDDQQMTHHTPLNFTLPKIDLSGIGNRNRFSEAVGCQGYDLSSYDPALTVLAMVYFGFGALYTIFGYRCFKTTLFLTGFTFGTIIVYIICLQEYLMTKIGNISVSVCAGVLFGLITTLIQYVGLFVEGCHTGVMLGFAGLSIYDHFIVVFPNTFWQSAVTLMCAGIFFAVITLYFKKGMTIFGTALYGGALLAVSIDYFVEQMDLLTWLWDRTKLMPVVPPPCRLTWLILAVWPAATFVGLTAQAFITGTKIYHEQSISAQKRRMKQQKSRPITREQRAELKQKKYRYLYQVRTAHGDVISQNYVQALQKKANGSNGNWNGFGVGESSTLQSDSTHLTVLAGSEHHHDSDDDIHQIRTAH